MIHNMSLIKSTFAVGNLIGQRCRMISQTWSRNMCNKPQASKVEPSAAAPDRPFSVPGHRPSDLDKKILVWAGRFKSAEQIPQIVSFEMVNAARNKIRVRACYVMIAVTVAACVMMVISGKKAARRNESLTSQNMEKKAKWRDEMEKERETVVEKVQ